MARAHDFSTDSARFEVHSFPSPLPSTCQPCKNGYQGRVNSFVKGICLINNANLTKSLQHLSHRRLVGDLFIFYRYFHGYCSPEIWDIIPVPLRCVRTTRSSTHSQPFQVSLPTQQTLSHKSSFIPRTGNLWNVLLSSYSSES